jgi:two-component system sensor histidine kinase MtrB
MSQPSPTDRRTGVRPFLRGLPGSALTFWRRSLTTRVVTAIVLLCALVVGSVGWMVMRQITDGLVKSRVDASVAEARTETATARERLGSAGGNDFDPDTQLRLLVENLVARGEVKGFEVVVLGPVGKGDVGGGVRSTPAVDVGSVPHGLRRAVERGEDGLAWTYTSINYTKGAAGRTPVPDQPGVAVGSTVVLPSDGGTYALYYLFPMGEEQQTLLLLRRVLLTAGVLLLVLVAGVAMLVTRQVISPVRLARRVAERIACTSPARTTSPGWRCRSTRWPRRCSRRSASWSSSRACSARSSRTSRTSCARP